MANTAAGINHSSQGPAAHSVVRPRFRSVRQLGIVTGLKAEARIIERVAGRDADLPWPNLGIAVSGASSRRAAELADRMLSRGADGLLSFGLAGGLDPSLKAGDIVIGDRVLAPDGSDHGCEHAWGQAIMDLKSDIPIRVGNIAGSEVAVTSRAEKRTLHNSTGAIAVDMESHAVAAVAAKAGVSFMAIRAIADSASQQVPWCALSGVSASGSMRPISVLLRLLLQPWQLPTVIAFGGRITARSKVVRPLRPARARCLWRRLRSGSPYRPGAARRRRRRPNRRRRTRPAVAHRAECQVPWALRSRHPSRRPSGPLRGA